MGALPRTHREARVKRLEVRRLEEGCRKWEESVDPFFLEAFSVLLERRLLDRLAPRKDVTTPAIMRAA